MIEQRTVLNLLNENAITETAPWIVGEPSLQELMGDPVVHAVLRRDGLSPQDLMGAIARARGRLSPALALANATVAPAPAVEMPVGGPPASDAA
jgi:hypothetical protein